MGARRSAASLKIYAVLLCVVLFSVFAGVWVISGLILKEQRKEKESFLLGRIRLFERQFLARFPKGMDVSEASKFCISFGERAGIPLMLLDASGRVLADSESFPASAQDLSGLPEIMEARAGRTGRDFRFHPPEQKRALFLAIPILGPQGVIAVARVFSTVSPITFPWMLSGIVFFVAVLSVFSCLWLTQRIRRPLQDMRRGVDRFARGEWGQRWVVSDYSQEVGALALSLNQMALKFDEKIQDTTRQQNEQEAILSSMREGVLALDMEEKIISINASVFHVFGLAEQNAKGRSIQEVIRNVDLHRFVEKTLGGEEWVEGEIVVFSQEERFLQARGTVLRDASGKKCGAVIVLHDVTRIQKLENMRRDFVSNVSHELKTPITSIQGFIETLRDGAIDQPEDAKRFLGIIAKQAERLNHIIENLLNLSRIEQEGDRGEILMELKPVFPVLEMAVQSCSFKANTKGVLLVSQIDKEVKARIHSSLLEQGIINLIDNAINASEPKNEVQILLEQTPEDVLIQVKDSGCGIAKEHLGRIFERFYRVDKARSRGRGGTGLGLAITKHIVQAHQGTLSVDSMLGKGSVFTIRFSKKNA